MNRRLATAASLVAVAATMGLSACSSSSTGSSSSGSSAAKPIVGPATLTGMQTAVTLDTKTIDYLKGLGVTVAGNGKAHGVTLSDGAAVAFPITGGTVTVYTKGTHTPYVEGMINHVGSGITLTAGSKSVKLTDFLVNPGTSTLSGTVDTGSGTPMTNVPLFFLDGPDHLRHRPVHARRHQGHSPPGRRDHARGLLRGPRQDPGLHGDRCRAHRRDCLIAHLPHPDRPSPLRRWRAVLCVRPCACGSSPSAATLTAA